ncbi:hypothetical protein [Mitsuokella jalaludinii]|uniref:hypothetical protein n=1 Tax=Mitsuokella jalaludinii TaxID=187979 RepID=UPI00307A3938
MNVIDKICGKFGLSDPDEDEKLALAEEEERERERSQKRAAEQREQSRSSGERDKQCSQSSFWCFGPRECRGGADEGHHHRAEDV